MFRLTLFCLCVTLVLGTPALKKHSRVVPRELPGPRIVGGDPAKPGEFPYQVALFIETWFCGGSIINEEWILTAGHCIQGAGSGVVVTGSTDPDGGDINAIGELILHEDYNNETLENDIALIKLFEPLTLGGNVEAVQLNFEQLGAGQEVVVSGWGHTSDDAQTISDTLNYVSLVTVSNDECQQSYSVPILEEMVCAGPENDEIKGGCSGDSGGPVVIRGDQGVVQVAVVSFAPTTGCETGAPTGFTRVASYEQWIQSHIQSK